MIGDVLIPFGIIGGLTAAYALFWTLCVIRVGSFPPASGRGCGAGDEQYEKRNNEDDAGVLRPRPRALMNMVLRLSGWRCVCRT